MLNIIAGHSSIRLTDAVRCIPVATHLGKRTGSAKRSKKVVSTVLQEHNNVSNIM